eukprot:2173291-Rhodomonas_salina.5
MAAQDGFTALHAAAVSGQLDAVKILLAHGVNFDTQNAVSGASSALRPAQLMQARKVLVDDTRWCVWRVLVDVESAGR